MGVLDDRAGLAGKAAIVVGGAGGLGRAATLDLTRAGVTVAVVDRDAAALASTDDDRRALGPVGPSAAVDARDPDALAEFFAAAVDKLGRLDILVNVVGGTFRQPFAESTVKGWDTLVRTNFGWLLHAVQLAVAPMRTAGGGSVVNVTSIEAHRAAPGFAVYAAMKAAVTSLTRTLAVELGGDRIRVNTIAPDWIPTEGMARIDGAEIGREADGAEIGREADVEGLGVRMAIPLRRRATAEDFGNCVLFLASELSAAITGTSLHPDGGALAVAGWLDWPEEGYRLQPPPDVLAGLLEEPG